MTHEVIDDVQLQGVTGGRFLPRLRGWWPAIGFAAAAIALKPVADRLADVAQLRVPNGGSK